MLFGTLISWILNLTSVIPFCQVDPVHAHCQQQILGLAFGSLLLKPSNEVPTWRCTADFLGAAGLGTPFKTYLRSSFVIFGYLIICCKNAGCFNKIYPIYCLI